MSESNRYIPDPEAPALLKCMYCEQDRPDWAKRLRAEDPDHRKCMLCERYFTKNRLFLNNVG